MAQYKGAPKEAGRAINLLKKRQKEQEELEIRKKKIEEELRVGAIGNKFAVHYDAIENKLKSDTIGLVTLNEMKAKQEDVVKEREKQMVSGKESLYPHFFHDKNRIKNQRQGPLSFGFQDEVEEENEEDEEKNELEKKKNIEEINKQKKEKDEIDIEKKIRKEKENENEKNKNKLKVEENECKPEIKKFKMIKCPDVDTSFLPDREREEKEAKLREQLRQEWIEKQEKIKNEEIEITYSFWDGSGHRRQVRMRKGNTIQQFLQRCLEQLRKEFNELKTASVDKLMYVKEDLIIAQHFSFYDFIVTKARGKSGPLFNFDVHEDVRMLNDATVEKDESHAGKVCLRSWYEKNKHIFPASRWEPFDPEKKWARYTISDKDLQK